MQRASPRRIAASAGVGFSICAFLTLHNIHYASFRGTLSRSTYAQCRESFCRNARLFFYLMVLALPQYVVSARRLVQCSGQDEQQIRQTIQILDKQSAVHISIFC